MPADRVEHYKSRDPILLGRQHLLEKGAMAEAEVDAIQAGVEAEMAEAIAFAKGSQEPSLKEFQLEVEANR